MEKEWWYSIDESRIGPISIDDIRKNLTDGKLFSSSLVWKEGMDEWLPFSNIPELRNIVRSVPPELPQRSGQNCNSPLPIAGPFRRFFARSIDVYASFVLLAPIIILIAPNYLSYLSEKPVLAYILALLFIPASIGINVLIFGIFRITLGKFLLAVKITAVNGQKPTISQYLNRELGCCLYGWGIGIPTVGEVLMILQFYRIQTGKCTIYDKGKFNVNSAKLGFLRGVLSFGAMVILSIVYIVIFVICKLSFGSGTS